MRTIEREKLLEFYCGIIEKNRKDTLKLVFRNYVGILENTKDIHQDAIVKFIEKFDSDQIQANISDQGVAGLIYKISKDSAIDGIREKKGKVFVTISNEISETLTGANPAAFSKNNIDSVIKEALAVLTEKARNIIIDRYFLGMTFLDIAEKYGAEEGTVRKMVTVSKHKMKVFLEGKGISLRDCLPED